MREILFRGKKVDNGKWVYGYFTVARFIQEDNSRQLCESIEYIDGGLSYNSAVIPETVGQYTGLNDKNGTKIFEGDIIYYDDDYFKLEWDVQDANYCLDNSNVRLGFYHIWSSETEIIGNIHDNPELLEV